MLYAIGNLIEKAPTMPLVYDLCVSSFKMLIKPWSYFYFLKFTLLTWPSKVRIDNLSLCLPYVLLKNLSIMYK